MSVPVEFKTAIGVKLIEYAEMDVLTFSKTYGRSAKSTEVNGYVVRYPDGYISWSPKSVFESSYFPIENGVKLAPSDIENFVDFSHGDFKALEKTTVQYAKTITGFEYIGTSPCVNPSDYKHELGIEYACDQIRDKVWEHLGFVLQWAKNGITPKLPVVFEGEVLETATPAVESEFNRTWVDGTVDEPGHWEDL